MSDSQGNVCTQLMRNAEILCTRFADSTTFTGWDFATGVVVTDANQGDHVYVRMGQNNWVKCEVLIRVKLLFLVGYYLEKSNK